MQSGGPIAPAARVGPNQGRDADGAHTSQVYPAAVGAHQVERLDRLVGGGGEAVLDAGVEFGGLAGVEQCSRSPGTSRGAAGGSAPRKAHQLVGGLPRCGHGWWFLQISMSPSNPGAETALPATRPGRPSRVPRATLRPTLPRLWRAPTPNIHQATRHPHWTRHDRPAMMPERDEPTTNSVSTANFNHDPEWWLPY